MLQAARLCDAQIRKTANPPPAAGGQFASYERGQKSKNRLFTRSTFHCGRECLGHLTFFHLSPIILKLLNRELELSQIGRLQITLHSLDPKLVKMTVGCGICHTITKTHIQYT
jgi:hypothetical protein